MGRSRSRSRGDIAITCHHQDAPAPRVVSVQVSVVQADIEPGGDLVLMLYVGREVKVLRRHALLY